MLGADGLLYAQAPGGLAVLNRDGTRRALIRSSPLGRDGRVYAIRGRGEQLVAVGSGLRLHEVGGRIAFGKYSRLVGVSAAGRPALDFADRNGIQKREALGPGELIYRATPGNSELFPYPARPEFSPYPARLEAIGPDEGVRWSLALPTDPTALAAAPDGQVRVALASGEVLAVSPGGVPLWRASLPAGPMALAVAPDGSTYSLSGGPDDGRGAGLLVGLTGSGAPRLRLSLPGQPVGPPLLGREGVIYLPVLGALVAVSATGQPRFTLSVPGHPSRLALGPDGRVAFASTTAASGLSSLFVLAPPLASPQPVTDRLAVSARRFRSAGPVSVCPAGARGACRPAAPLGTTLAVRLADPSRVGIAVRRRGARRPAIRSTIGDAGAGPLWLRFNERSWHNRHLGGGPLRGLCAYRYCQPLRAGAYRITLTLRSTSGRTRELRADVVVVRG